MELINPYGVEVNVCSGGDINKQVFLLTDRRKLIAKYSWAIPDREAIELIVKYSPLVEVGAGNGYWAYLISQLGGEIICFDKYPGKIHQSEEYFEQMWYPVSGEDENIVTEFSDRSLFLCWAPYNDDMAVNCLRNYSGNTVVYVGEGVDGCCANDAFFELLTEKFTLCDGAEIPSYLGINDKLFVFQRKQVNGGVSNGVRNEIN